MTKGDDLEFSEVSRNPGHTSSLARAGPKRKNLPATQRHLSNAEEKAAIFEGRIKTPRWHDLRQAMKRQFKNVKTLRMFEKLSVHVGVDSCTRGGPQRESLVNAARSSLDRAITTQSDAVFPSARTPDPMSSSLCSSATNP